MTVPKPQSLSLGEAASYVADRCKISIEKAKAALERAFREHSASAYSRNWLTQAIPVKWDGVTIAWENSELKGARGVVVHREVYVLRKHLDEWMNESALTAAPSSTISLDDASVQIGKAKFGGDWIGKLTERERWLIKRYVEQRHQRSSSIVPGEITYVGPGGPFIPVNDPVLAAEVERARDRLEQMNDQYDQAGDWLEDHGFDVEAESLDLAKFQRLFAAAFATVFSAPAVPARGADAAKDRHQARADQGGHRGKNGHSSLGYVSKWLPLLAAIEHVRGVTCGTVDEACDAVLPALRDGAVKSRYRGQPLGGVAGTIEGWGGEISPERWYRATVNADGTVEFEDEPGRSFGLHRLGHEIEVSTDDLYGVWPQPKPHDELPFRQASDEPPQAVRQSVGNATANPANSQEGVPIEPALANPEATLGRAVGDAYTHSGFPGRPSKGKHLIEDEFERRVAAGQALPLVADEARALLDWFKGQHPTIARPTPKTIQENIRARHRQWRANQPEPKAK